MANLNVRINNKFDTYENWMSSTLVLGAGEIAVASIPSGDNTGLTPPAIGVKIGDGSKTFSQLSWIQAIAGDVSSWAKAANKPEYQASEIKGLSEYISGEIEDTDTQYKLVKVDDYNYKLQSKALTGGWTDVEGSAFVIPKYDDTALAGRVTANEGAIAGIKDGTSINSFKAVETALAGKANNGTVTEVSERVAAIEGDYLKAADKYNDTELKGRVSAIEADYLKAADKTELNGKINGILDGTAIDSFSDVEAALAGKQAAGDYATNGTVNEVSERVAAIEGDYLKAADKYNDTALVGRVAAIEGDYLKAADKTEVEGKITAAQGAAEAAQGAVDTLAGKVGTVAEGKTVVKMIEEAQAAATYDDTALAGRVTTNEGAIEALDGQVSTLIGEDSGKSARSIAAEETAKIVAGAGTAYDTLKEIADWISTHGSDAATMQSNIVTLQNQLKGIAAEEGSVKKYVDDAIAALNVGQYALAADLTALAGRVTTLEGEMEAAQTAIENLGKADETLQGNIDALDESLAAIAKTGNVNDLVQTAGDVLIFNCGTSAV